MDSQIKKYFLFLLYAAIFIEKSKFLIFTKIIIEHF